MSTLGNFVWSIADQLRGVYRPAQYGGVILPFTILRRLDCQLAATRDQVRELAQTYDGAALDIQVKRATGLSFYNTSEFDFAALLADPEGLRANLTEYLNGFSANIDVFERFKFDNELATLDEKNRLYLVVSAFAEIDLHPDTVPNAEMGDLFEELIRKFAEASNEDAGEHYTPRDAIRLLVDLLFAEDSAALLEAGTVRTLYDPTAGTGGMLSVGEERLLERNPKARLRLYGQELNDQSYAICKSDMIAKGQDATNIQLGDTLAEDKFADKTFDFCLSNPPYGFDWKASEAAVKAEAAASSNGRFSHGLPAIGDGQMLFLTHLAHKMRPEHEGGGRAGIVMSGSPLFNGDAGSGPSEIRRWLLENDLVEAIVALPTDMFFNTGIGTYIWILDNSKQPERRGKVQLIDARELGSKMRKSLGSKRKEIAADERDRILAIYDAFDNQAPGNDEFSKVLPNAAFGYWKITHARPVPMRYEVDVEAVKRVHDECTPEAYLAVQDLHGRTFQSAQDLFVALGQSAKGRGNALKQAESRDAIRSVGQPVDEHVKVTYKGASMTPEPLTDTEIVPFGYTGPDTLPDYDRSESECVAAYMAAEVLPYYPDAAVQKPKLVKGQPKQHAGYEIPFTRHFYKYVPPRPLAEIDEDLNKQAALVMEMLRKVEAS